MKIRKIVMLFMACVSLWGKADENDDRRQAFIRDFITYYQSAYQNKKLSYIAQFFSNDALIITETKQLIPTGSEVVPNTTKTRPYHSVIEDRSIYIERLQEYFANNDNVSVGISNLIIRRHTKHPEIYGVNFFQIWDDTGATNILENRMPGYIFLMVDFRNNEIEPTVHVRTWQPKSNIKEPSDKYTLTDFRIISIK